MVNLLILSIVLTGAFIGAFGTLMIKKSTTHYPFFKLFKSSFLWIGLFFYVLSTLFYIFALRKEELSIIYPLVSTTYIWTTFFSVKYLKEKMDVWKWVGLSGIIIGVVFIGLGS